MCFCHFSSSFINFYLVLALGIFVYLNKIISSNKNCFLKVLVLVSVLVLLN